MAQNKGEGRQHEWFGKPAVKMHGSMNNRTSRQIKEDIKRSIMYCWVQYIQRLFNQIKTHSIQYVCVSRYKCVCLFIYIKSCAGLEPPHLSTEPPVSSVLISLPHKLNALFIVVNYSTSKLWNRTFRECYSCYGNCAYSSQKHCIIYNLAQLSVFLSEDPRSRRAAWCFSPGLRCFAELWRRRARSALVQVKPEVHWQSHVGGCRSGRIAVHWLGCIETRNWTNARDYRR